MFIPKSGKQLLFTLFLLFSYHEVGYSQFGAYSRGTPRHEVTSLFVSANPSMQNCISEWRKSGGDITVIHIVENDSLKTFHVWDIVSDLSLTITKDLNNDGKVNCLFKTVIPDGGSIGFPITTIDLGDDLAYNFWNELLSIPRQNCLNNFIKNSADSGVYYVDLVRFVSEELPNVTIYSNNNWAIDIWNNHLTNRTNCVVRPYIKFGKH